MTGIRAGIEVQAARRAVAAGLAAAGIDEPQADARVLIEAATGETREALVIDPARCLSATEAMRLSQFVERRLMREPVSRIVGERGFYGRTFKVTPDTLDPRPDTETLVELALDIAREETWTSRPIGILDIGTGTGCILLTLLAELQLAHGLGTDISATALGVARHNARRLGLSDRATWQQARSLDGLDAAFELVVSNPPYIPSADIAGLEPEVQRFDPHLALDGGPDGLSMYREIVVASAGSATVGTWWVVEVGAGQAAAVAALVGKHCGARAGDAVRWQQDLGGHTRCVAWKPRI